jgi:hypothetical protein
VTDNDTAPVVLSSPESLIVTAPATSEDMDISRRHSRRHRLDRRIAGVQVVHRSLE